MFSVIVFIYIGKQKITGKMKLKLLCMVLVALALGK